MDRCATTMISSESIKARLKVLVKEKTAFVDRNCLNTISSFVSVEYCWK